MLHEWGRNRNVCVIGWKAKREEITWRFIMKRPVLDELTLFGLYVVLCSSRNRDRRRKRNQQQFKKC
jgi:hypothetical protein